MLTQTNHLPLID